MTLLSKTTLFASLLLVAAAAVASPQATSPGRTTMSPQQMLNMERHPGDHHRHPNLAAAERLTQRADQRITDAQKDNEWDMDGHAAKAKELLDQAQQELRSAAVAANHDRH